MSILDISKLNYSYGVEEILKDVSIIIEKGDKVGIVGVNGAGKSSLLKLILGEYDKNSIVLGEAFEKEGGSISIQKGLSLAYLKQREHFNGDLSVWDAIDSKIDPKAFEEKNGYSLEKGKRGILSSLGFSEEMYKLRANSLSGGEQTRLALGAVLLEEPDILLLDEPTNHLDISTLSWLESKIKTYRGTVLVVSHDRYFLDKVASKILEIENKNATLYNGNYTQYKEKKQLKYEEELKHYEIQAEEIKRQEELITRWHERGTEHLVKRAQSREKRLAQIEKLNKPVLFKEEIKVSFKQNLQTGNDVIITQGLGFKYPNSSNMLIEDFDCIIKKGERVCIVGPNGAGKTTLLKMLMGIFPPTKGRIKLGTNVIPAYYDQQQENLNPNNTVLNELYNCPGILVGPGEYIRIEAKYNEADLRKLLGAMAFRGDDVFKRVGDLAGGEKARLSLLKLMMSGANVLILDEPTNHLDISSKEVFEDALLAFPGTEIIVSHDRYLIEKVSTRQIEIGKAEGKSFNNTLNEKKAEIGEFGYIKGSEEERQAKKKAEAKRRKDEKLLFELEAKVKEIEEKKAELLESLCLPEVFNDIAKAKELNDSLEKLKAELEACYEKWLELSS